ncbi:hypothetical protein DERP_000017 [Dermatophagoides pteronyssinus]|uniref:Uncharacterized protein n=1 Tax=Dermatophagoides pteronyssinus TaxID=6956 RepID=A0ABQ8IZ27_DERPT|nr:hypothetical protein DERP_000017 [Dermatophagoides pteronyssinus]
MMTSINVNQIKSPKHTMFSIFNSWIDIFAAAAALLTQNMNKIWLPQHFILSLIYESISLLLIMKQKKLSRTCSV